MKPIVLYHAHCADGFGAAFAAWMKFGEDAEYRPMRYMETKGKSDAELLEEFSLDMMDAHLPARDVYILDYSLPKPVMDWLLGRPHKVVWLDHHKTAFEMWCPVEREKHVSLYPLPNDHVIVLDNNRSGALIAWDYFFPNQATPMVIQHIDDYDRWQFKLTDTKACIKALWSITPWSFEQWRILVQHHTNSHGRYLDFVREGDAILRAHEQNVQAVTAYPLNIEIPAKLHPRTGDPHIQAPETRWGCRGWAANVPPHLSSDAGHVLATEGGTYGAVWYLSDQHTVKVSLRSNGDYDVSSIAKEYGGGGHKNAAGFSVGVQTFLSWLQEGRATKILS